MVEDFDSEFFENYGKYLENARTPDGADKFYPYGVNYYTKEQTVSILQRIKKDKPKEYEIFAEWLEKAVSEYNGFYFLGV